MTPTLLMTRPEHQNASFADQIAASWDAPLTVIHSPLTGIVPVVTQITTPDAVIFTSANGVAAAAQFHLPIGMTAWCVGKKTAQVAKAAGFAPNVGPGDAAGLVAHIISAKPLGTFAHIRGMHTRGDVADRLQAAGLNCADVVAYDQKALPLTAPAQTALAGKSAVIVPLFSPRTGVIFNAQGPYQAKVFAPVISAAVQETLEPSVVACIEPALRPDAKAMYDATLVALRAAVAST